MKKDGVNTKATPGTVVSEFKVPFPGDERWANRPSAIPLPDGQLYVMDSVEDIPAKFYIGRVNGEGDFDKAFGGVGWKATPMDMDAAYPAGLLLRADGGAIAGLSSSGSIGLACFKPDGTLDSGFGEEGVIVHRASWQGHEVDPPFDYPAPLQAGSSQAMVPAEDGGFYALFYGVHNTFGTVLRCTADGRLDPSFNETGRVTLTYPDNAIAVHGVVTMPDGGATVVGSVGNTFYGMRAYFARLRADGTRDTDFGDKGYAVIDPASLGFPAEHLIAMELRQVTSVEQALIASGYVTTKDAEGKESSYGLVISVTFQGRPNEAFNRGKPVLFQEIPDAQVRFLSGGIHEQGDRKIVVGGDVTTDKNSDLVVARYLPNGSLDETFAGKGWTRFGAARATKNAMRDLSLDDAGDIIVSCTGDGLSDSGRYGAVLKLAA